ncbi:hypothetical protein Tco_0151552 [Tanacetum coccineum]
MTNKIDTVLKAITDRIIGVLPSDTVKNPKLNVNPTCLVLFPRSYPTEDPQCSTQKVHKLNSFLESSGLVPRSSDQKFVCTKEDDRDVMFIEIIKKYDDSHEEELEVEVNAMTEGLGVEYFDTSPTRSELTYHKAIRLAIGPKKEHTKSVYLRNEEDKRRGVEYVINKILGLYKECLELGPEYLTRVADEEGVTNIGSNSSSDGLAALVSKLDNLGRDMKKRKKNVHAIQVGCKICKGPHLNKECPLNEEVKQIEEVKYGEYGNPFSIHNQHTRGYGSNQPPKD